MDMIQVEQRIASEKLPELQVIEDNWFKPTVHYTTATIPKTSKKWVVDMSGICFFLPKKTCFINLEFHEQNETNPSAAMAEWIV